MTVKVCTECGIEYPATLGFFPANRRLKCGLMARCRQCNREYQRLYRDRPGKRKLAQKRTREWCEANPVKKKEMDRRANLRYKYDLSLVGYDYIWDQQGGVCKTCGNASDDGRRLAVDHDHKTGKVRGLLCRTCNLAVGFLKDDIDLVAKVLSYLKGE